ncbi:MAG: hypothetical protein EOP06_18780 [Proteobacteria bacterium]|nr:MAG: hypothetical protein EOP06_18780 [Pseudomonadota bacterium]
MLDKIVSYMFLFAIATGLNACSDAIPQVQLLDSATRSDNVPDTTGSSNLSATTLLQSPSVKIRSRISYVGLQETLTNNEVVIKGKVRQ